MTSASPVFDFAVRAIACINCGAPQRVPPGGGTVECGHCRSALVIEPRRVESTRSEPAPLPASAYDLEAFLRSTGCEGKPWSETLPVFRAAWNEARRQPGVEGGYRLYGATAMLATGHGAQGDQLARRAVLETAVELLPDRGHRCILRCHLARAANRLGEREAALAWLGQCDATGLAEVVADEIRVTKASLANAAGHHARVLELVPPAQQATGASASLGAQLRIDSLESLGRDDEARQELEIAIERHGREVVLGWMAVNELGPRSRAAFTTVHTTASPRSSAPMTVAIVLVLLALAGGVAIWVLAAIN
ncbi:tetratricopeptide repeat protein [Paraliomyxa miuraensis]|uniref:hypothetical protein n=1 Tax=Paraliomyxa miuraensis TaxID=376150 RepID=UPI002251B83E|nr:hypothetical protein [Paraliomyxa miuraensis]MCX4244973.1 zinc-ribbon domain-containing protein [Paraliomyxa miuraensis]